MKAALEPIALGNPHDISSATRSQNSTHNQVIETSHCCIQSPFVQELDCAPKATHPYAVATIERPCCSEAKSSHRREQDSVKH